MTEQEWEMLEADERNAADEEFLQVMQEMYDGSWDIKEVA